MNRINVNHASDLIVFLKHDLEDLPEKSEEKTTNELMLELESELFFWMPAFVLPFYHKRNLCGTSACLAGSIYLMNHDKDVFQLLNARFYDIVHEARDFLEINDSAANALFSPQIRTETKGEWNCNHITRTIAIKVLRHLMDCDLRQKYIDGDVVYKFWIDALKGKI